MFYVIYINNSSSNQLAMRGVTHMYNKSLSDPIIHKFGRTEGGSKFKQKGKKASDLLFHLRLKKNKILHIMNVKFCLFIWKMQVVYNCSTIAGKDR